MQFLFSIHLCLDDQKEGGDSLFLDFLEINAYYPLHDHI